MAISIPTVVGSYIDGVVDALTKGSELDNPPNDPATMRAAAQNYLRAQDAATIVELLAGLVVTGELTASAGGSATTIVVPPGTFVPGVWAGATVTFEADTSTAALQGESAVIESNDYNSLSLASALPASVADGDTFTVSFASAVAALVDEVRQGQTGYDAPRGSVYGDARTVEEMFRVLCAVVSGESSTAALNALAANFTNGDVVTLGSRTYTMQDTLSDVDGNVHIGASSTATLTNLINAVNATGGTPGTDYAASTTANPDVFGIIVQASVGAFAARLPGEEGNSLVSTTDASLISFVQGDTFSGGTSTGLPARSEYTLPAGAYQIPTVHTAAQPGDNLWFGYVIDFVRDAVAGFNLPVTP